MQLLFSSVFTQNHNSISLLSDLDTMTFKLTSVFNQDAQGLGTETDITEKPIGKILPFPDWMAKTLKSQIQGTGVIGLCGPSGSGRKTLIKQVSFYPVREYIVDRMLGVKDMKSLTTWLQPTLDGPCVWMIYPAELLDENLKKAIVKKPDWQVKICLVGNEKMWGLDESKIIYHKCDSHVQDVAIHIKATREQMTSCCNDLRQLQLSAMLGHCGGLDKAPHIYFDTLAILNKKTLPLASYNIPWLEQNVPASTNNLEQLSKFYNNLAETDTMQLWKHDPELEAEIVRLFLPRDRRPPSKLIKPRMCTTAYNPTRQYGWRRWYAAFGNDSVMDEPQKKRQKRDLNLKGKSKI